MPRGQPRFVVGRTLAATALFALAESLAMETKVHSPCGMRNRKRSDDRGDVRRPARIWRIACQSSVIDPEKAFDFSGRLRHDAISKCCSKAANDLQWNQSDAVGDQDLGERRSHLYVYMHCRILWIRIRTQDGRTRSCCNWANHQR